MWHGSYTKKLADIVEKELGENGLRVLRIDVPGSFELVQTTKMVSTYKDKGCCINGIVCIGILVKGDTAHFEYLSSSISQTLCTLSAAAQIPIIYGIHNLYNKDQIEEKLGGDKIQAVAAGWASAMITQIINYREMPSKLLELLSCH